MFLSLLACLHACLLACLLACLFSSFSQHLNALPKCSAVDLFVCLIVFVWFASLSVLLLAKGCLDKTPSCLEGVLTRHPLVKG